MDPFDAMEALLDGDAAPAEPEPAPAVGAAAEPLDNAGAVGAADAARHAVTSTLPSVRALAGRLSALRVSRSDSVLCGAFVWATGP